MEPAGIEPATSCLQSSTVDDVREAETPEKSGDSGKQARRPISGICAGLPGIKALVFKPAV